MSTRTTDSNLIPLTIWTDESKGNEMRRHMMYVITAQVLTEQDGYTGSRQVPTFYLDSALQGITDVSHATDIAKTIIDPMGSLELSIHAEPMPVHVPGPPEPAEPYAAEGQPYRMEPIPAGETDDWGRPAAFVPPF
jgi:hypothetical protein